MKRKNGTVMHWHRQNIVDDDDDNDDDDNQHATK